MALSSPTSFRRLAVTLGGIGYPSYESYLHLPSFHVEQLEWLTGSIAEVRGGMRRLLVPVTEGTALILGTVGGDGLIRDGEIFLVRQPERSPH